MATIQFKHSRAFPHGVDPLKAGEINGFWELREGDVGAPIDMRGFRYRALGFQDVRAPITSFVVPGSAHAKNCAAIIECRADGEDWQELAEINASRPNFHPPEDKPLVRARALRGAVKVELAARNDRN